MLQWESLVTEGQVLAARWRKASPWLLAIALTCSLSGVAIAIQAPQHQSFDRSVAAKQAYASEVRSSLQAFLIEKANSNFNPANAERAPGQQEALARVAAFRASVLEHGRLPNEVLVVGAEEFWRGDWPPGVTLAVRNRGNILIGLYVDTSPGYRSPPRLQRMYGLFRRRAQNWIFYCVNAPSAVPCSRTRSVDASSIPVTMRSLAPASAFKRAG